MEIIFRIFYEILHHNVQVQLTKEIKQWDSAMFSDSQSYEVFQNKLPAKTFHFSDTPPSMEF